MAWVQSPSVGACMVAVGIPPNIDSVHAVWSSGCAAFHSIISCDMPCHPEMSLWLTIFPERTSGTNAYESTRKPSSTPTAYSIFFFMTVL